MAYLTIFIRGSFYIKNKGFFFSKLNSLLTGNHFRGNNLLCCKSSWYKQQVCFKNLCCKILTLIYCILKLCIKWFGSGLLMLACSVPRTTYFMNDKTTPQRGWITHWDHLGCKCQSWVLNSDCVTTRLVLLTLHSTAASKVAETTHMHQWSQTLLLYWMWL